MEVPADADRAPLPSRHAEKHERDASYAELVERHRPLVERLCRVLLRDSDQAEDAAQQTFLLAFESLLSGVRPRRPRAWLCTIARHECWALAQRGRRERATAWQALSSPTPDAYEQAVQNEELSALVAELERLPARQKQALVLRALGGLSYQQLAIALDISESAADALLIRARRSLGRRRPLIPLPFALPRLESLRHALTHLIHRTERLCTLAAVQATVVGAATTLIPVAAAATLAAAGASGERQAHAAPPPAERVRAISPAPRPMAKHPKQPPASTTIHTLDARRGIHRNATVKGAKADAGTTTRPGGITTGAVDSRHSTAPSTTILTSAPATEPPSPTSRTPTRPPLNHTGAGRNSGVPTSPPLAAPAPPPTGSDPTNPDPAAGDTTQLTPTPPSEPDTTATDPQHGATDDHGTGDGTTPGADPQPTHGNDDDHGHGHGHGH